MSLIAQVLKHSLALAAPRDRFLLRGPRRRGFAVHRRPFEIALTFDDGPHPAWTPAVLDALAAARWRGTFFVVGERASRYPDLVRRIAEEGHCLGNHTYSHAYPTRITADAFLDEVRDTHELIRNLTGISTSLMRPPLGKLTRAKLLGLWRERQSVVLWNVDPRDYRMQHAPVAVRWATEYAPRRGDIVLLHDSGPSAAQIVRTLHQRGDVSVRSVPLTDWLPASVTRVQRGEAVLA